MQAHIPEGVTPLDVVEAGDIFGYRLAVRAEHKECVQAHAVVGIVDARIVNTEVQLFQAGANA